MPDTNAISSYNASLQRWNGAAFEDVLEVIDFGFNPKLETQDASTLKSTNNWRERVAVIKDGGQVPFSFHYLPDDAQQNGTDGLMADLKGEVLQQFKIVWPDATEIAFDAHVIDLNAKAKVGEILGATATLEISGEPTFSV